VSELDPEFASLDKRKAVIDLDEFAQICGMTK
jgi:hypothetical protein